MGKWIIPIFLGLLIAFFLLYILEPERGVNIIVFLSIGLVFLFKALLNIFLKRKKERSNENINNER